MSDTFYADLPSFTNFAQLGTDSYYQPLPNDWYVVICDIRGSTKAIAEGRYQDVNTLGAASIAALGEVWKTDDIPFVFGGDGASILVPRTKLEDVKTVLLKLKNFAQANYRMDMRVGFVAMEEIRAAELPIEVAKYTVVSTKAIALIRGGGLSWAEDRIKSDPARYCIEDDKSGTLGELQGLSCRWQPLEAKRGKIVSLLVRSRTTSTVEFPAILEKLEEILGEDFLPANPVSVETMKYKSLMGTLRTEWKYIGSVFSRTTLNRLVSILVSIWAFAKNFPAPFDAKKYTESIPSHSDYKKFDDMLRMVIDCTPAQVTEIRRYLTQLFEEKRIFFGMHESSHALMTCLVGNLSEGGHIHFIDGGDGGYAIAAKYLKEQMHAAKEIKGL